MKKVNNKTLSTRVSEDVYNDVVEQANEIGVSIAQFTEDAVGFYMYCLLLDEEEDNEEVSDLLDEYFGEDEDEEEDDEEEEDEDEED